MSKSKLLSDAGWKDVAAKSKVKDNGLLKALEKLKRLGDDDHDETTKVLDEVGKLAGLLKKDKAVAATPAAAKYVAEVIGEAQAAARDVAKAKAEHDKAQKAKAEAEKKAAAKNADDDEDDEEADARAVDDQAEAAAEARRQGRRRCTPWWPSPARRSS